MGAECIATFGACGRELAARGAVHSDPRRRIFLPTLEEVRTIAPTTLGITAPAASSTAAVTAPRIATPAAPTTAAAPLPLGASIPTRMRTAALAMPLTAAPTVSRTAALAARAPRNDLCH